MTAPFHCSFCAKSQHEVRKLIVGPAAFICDECVELCVAIVDEERPLRRIRRPIVGYSAGAMAKRRSA